MGDIAGQSTISAEAVGAEAFDRDALTFLRSHADERVDQAQRWGQGSDQVAIFPDRNMEDDLRNLAEARVYSQARFDAGFGWISGPVEYGGRGLPKAFEQRFAALQAKFATPELAVYGIGLTMIAPTILAHGNEEVRQRYLRSMFRGDIVACQLFSEPGAGSDLAGLQTSAMRDGDEWIVNGQKVWTSGAHVSDIGEIICRSDPTLPKHRNLTGFIVDMHAPGVEVRPLRQMTGGATFNEVFFTDVRIPDSHRLGEVHGGWGVALTTLMNERASIGSGGTGRVTPSQVASGLTELVRRHGRADDPLVRQQLAQVVICGLISSWSQKRALARMAGGQPPGPEMSLAKLELTQNLGRICDLVTSVLGPALVADTGEWGTFAWAEFLLGVPGLRIAGGSDEVLHNIIGERVLGLPKDPPVVTPGGAS